MPAAAAGEAAPDERRGPRPADAARPAQRRSGGGHAWQEFRRAALLAKEVGAASVRKHGRSITITYQQPVQRPAPTPAPTQQPVQNGEPSAEQALRHRPPSWHRRAAARRSRFFEAKDNSAVDSALSDMVVEAAEIAAMTIDAGAPMTMVDAAHAMGPAESAVSASAPTPALPSFPDEHAAPWSRPLNKGADPSLGASHACRPLPSPPSQPPLAKKFARPKG